MDGTLFKLVTDHEPNTYIKSIEPLNDRQARWNQKIERFSYSWVYRKGQDNIADPLSRMPECNVITRAMLKSAESPEEDEDLVGPTPSLPPGLPQNKRKKPVYKRPVTKVKPSDFHRAYSDPAWAEERKGTTYRKGANKLWYFGNKVVIPAHPNCKELREALISEHHDTPLAGHQGLRRTKASLTRLFTWKRLHTDVLEYIDGCYECAINKSSTQAPSGLLQPLPTPSHPWEWVSMDFVTGFPCTEDGYDAMVVFVDMLTKLVHIRPCTKKGLDTAAVVKMFEEEVLKHHGIPRHIVSDRDKVLTSAAWKELLKRLNSSTEFSSTYHPETDG